MQFSELRSTSIAYFTAIPDTFTMLVRLFQPAFECQVYTAENGNEKHPIHPLQRTEELA
jgi:hypothetical protein